MTITIKQLRDLIAGRPDAEEVFLVEIHGDEVGGIIHLELAGTDDGRASDGRARLVVVVRDLEADADDDFDREDD